MSERYIDICNWERFQHKDVWRKSGGRPPWIKNYTQLLHKDEYMDLSQSQRGILHGLWLMYASAGRSLGEAGAKRRLCRSDAEAKWWRRNLEALRDAGLIEILAQPIRAPVAPRVEESRVDRSLSKTEVSSSSEPKPGTEWAKQREKEKLQEQQERGNGWVENLSSYTGCRIVRGEVGVAHKYDPLGVDPVPVGWSHSRPTRAEVADALAEREASVA